MTEPNFTAGDSGQESSPHVVVVGPDGTPVGAAKLPTSDEEQESVGDAFRCR